MQDLISRQAAIDALDGEIEITGRTNAEAVKGYVRLVRDRLERLPSAEPRKKGKWLVHGDIPKTCSCCHEDWDKYVNGDVWYSDELPNFCPNCGSYNGGKNEV